METLQQDIIFFVSWCIEQYKVYQGIDGKSAMELLDSCHVLEYLAENYDVLHTQGRQWLMEEIDEYIKNHKNTL